MIAQSLGTAQADVATPLGNAGNEHLPHELQAEFSVYDTFGTFTQQSRLATPPRLRFCFVNLYDITIVPEWISMIDGGRNMLEETQHNYW